jgi:hypothetical protein
VNAASGNFIQERQDLHLAQELEPGLPVAAPESMRELQDKLSRTPLVNAPPSRSQTGVGFSWSVLAVVAIVLGFVLAVVFMSAHRPIAIGNLATSGRHLGRHRRWQRPLRAFSRAPARLTICAKPDQLGSASRLTAARPASAVASSLSDA